jgi:hypothetical protein
MGRETASLNVAETCGQAGAADQGRQSIKSARESRNLEGLVPPLPRGAEAGGGVPIPAGTAKS